jgi:hypothetical protein
MPKSFLIPLNPILEIFDVLENFDVGSLGYKKSLLQNYVYGNINDKSNRVHFHLSYN